MNISQSEKVNEEYNSYFNFIKPNNSNDDDHSSSSSSGVGNKPRIRIPPLQISTDPLGLSFIPPSHQDNHNAVIANNDSNNDDIFKQLNFPHIKKPFYSPSSESSSISSSPQLKPIQTNEDIHCPDLISNNNVSANPLTKSNSNCFLSKNSVELSPAASFLAGFMASPSTDNSNFIPLSTLSAAEEENIIYDYTIGDTIGFGGFSTVRKAQHQITNETVAVKIINQYLMDDIEKLRLERELNIWKSLNHPRIIQLKKVIHANNKCYIICDYCSKGNLLTYLNTVKKLQESEAKRIFKEICQGVYYLHIDRKVCHKDLKLENILLDMQQHVKICDFGLAIYQKHHYHQKKNRREGDDDEEEAGGSLAYAAPEQIKQDAPLTCPKTDIWSLGVILYALVVGSLPFMDTYDLRLQKKILEGQYDMPSDLSLPLQQLIKDCLEYGPDKRCSIDQVLNSLWLKMG